MERRGRGVEKKVRASLVTKAQVRQMVRASERVVELNYFALVDNTYGSISYNGTDFNQCISQIPQGVTDSERVGDEAILTSIEFRLGIKVSTTTPVFLRVICFQWHPTSVPSYASILLDQHNTSFAPLTQYQHDTKQMYTILSDDLVSLSTVWTPVQQVYRVITRGFRKTIQYQAGSSSTATNMVYVMAVSDVSSAGPQVVFGSKILFHP
jgi:hypothetical protein